MQQTRILQPVSRMIPGTSNMGHFDTLIMTLSDTSQRDDVKYNALKVGFINKIFLTLDEFINVSDVYFCS